MSIVLGLNGAPLQGHDPAAALIVNGRVVAAVEEERLCRKKRAMGLKPTNAILEVLRMGNVTPNEVDIVAVPWLPKAMGYDETELSLELRSWLASIGFNNSKLEIHFVEHHVAHAWSGLCFSSDLHKKYAILVLDGSGESTGGAAFKFDKNLTCLWHLDQLSSAGIYYEAVTNYVGFSWGQEGKTMGLAAYGRPSNILMPDIPDIRIQPPLKAWSKKNGSPKTRHESIRASSVAAMQKINGELHTFNERADIALAAQNIVLNVIMRYVRELSVDIDGLILAGGVALNCSINVEVAKFCREHDIDFVVPPPASDTGVALGAAICVAYEKDGLQKMIDEPFLGAAFSMEDVEKEAQEMGLKFNLISYSDIVDKLYNQSYICGWFDGRSEIGPRALGKRCIIARPDSTYIRDKINVLKGRESWRPLAPSVSQKEFERTFENSYPSRHMLINAQQTYDNSAMRGVIHVDGTARPQVVVDDCAYLKLIKEMGKYSGCEAIVCTSFNRAGEPIVYSPKDALISATAMGLNALVGDGWIVYLEER